MTNIVFDRSYKAPGWYEVTGLDKGKCSLGLFEQAMKEKHGAFHIYVLGRVGYSGTKSHILRIQIVKTESGYGVCSPARWTFCGSQKPFSGIMSSASLELDKVTCSKCQRMNIKALMEYNKEVLGI